MADMETGLSTEASGAEDRESSSTEDAVMDAAVTTDSEEDAYREAIAGAILVALILLIALFFRWRPGPTIIDRWGISLIHPALHNASWQRIAQIRSTSFLALGSILAALIVVARDRWRALACLVAPTLAVLLTEYVLKPVIARRYAQVLCFPSGSTTAVAAMAVAWVIAVPRWIRPVVAIVGAFFVGLVCMAVIALQWHLPTDALGGVAFGAGVVLLVDGVIHLVVWAVRRRQRDRSTSDAPSLA